ncbi:hypothetical protein [Bosea sp. MMO-172]|uniref:hypothetical protein n=1 Tax=Bosea sp. MMO-172 TaxID=3127885 RepID=UPI003017DE85
MPELIDEWPLQSNSTLGSSVRAKGIERELRRKLPWAARKSLTVEAGMAVLRMPDASQDEFKEAAAAIADAVGGLCALPVLPSEAEDILSMSSRERHKWMSDGRLQSAGTRTVKLRGRAKAVTFHVFEPAHIEHILNNDLTEIWREEDAVALAENRRRAAGKAALTRAGKGAAKPKAALPSSEELPETQLDGWAEFAADGLLR